MLIKNTPTGRRWGDKREPVKSSVTVAGVKLTVVESDAWEGGDGTPEIQQQYWRGVWIEQPEVRRP